MKHKGSILADEIVQTYRREIFFKKLAERNKKKKEENNEQKIQCNNTKLQ